MRKPGSIIMGARYLHPKYATWLSVDPLAMKCPNVSPYAYCMGNPIVYPNDAQPGTKGFDYGFSNNTQERR